MPSVHGHEADFDEGMLSWLPSHILQELARDHSNDSKSISRSSSQRPKYALGGGPGMRAIFLYSGQRSRGTGVFLPHTSSGTKQTKNLACAPVLLPARVIQALNLKVHTIGFQLSPPQVPKYNPSEEVYAKDSTRKKNDRKDTIGQSSSPEIFLPKEWTY